MMQPSTLARRTIRQCQRNYHRWASVPTDGDDEHINTGPAYHPVVMMDPSTPDRRTI
jgi:hypothetical protein